MVSYRTVNELNWKLWYMRRKNFIPWILIPVLAFFVSSCRDVDIETVRKVLKEHQMEGAKYVGSETCGACHEKEVRNFKLAAHNRIAIPMEGVKVEGCEMCHGPGSLHAEGGGGKGNKIINPGKNPEMCFACHMEKKAEFKLPHHHPVLEGHMSCTDCHDPHGPIAKPWSATSMEDTNEPCFKCHKEQRGPFVFEHLAMREGCTTCHKVHGSINDKMLNSRDWSLCIRCHSSQSTIPVGGAPTGAHPTGIANGVCWSGACHTAPHGSNFDKHLRQ